MTNKASKKKGKQIIAQTDTERAVEKARLQWRDEAFARIEKMFGKTMSKMDLEDILMVLSAVR